MAFESPILIWLVLGALLTGIPAAIGLAVLISRLLKVASGCLTFIIFVVLSIVLFYLTAAFFNSAGAVVDGEVDGKNEALVYHDDGSWDRLTTLQVSYRPLEGGVSVTKTLNVSDDTFDGMRQGDFIKLRLSHANGIFTLVRLDDQDIFPQWRSMLLHQPFLLTLTLGFFFIVLCRMMFRAGLPLLVFLTGSVVVGAWWISDVLVPAWDEAHIRLGSLNTVNAIVRETTQTTAGNGLRGWLRNKIFAPYRLVLVDFTPLGHNDSVLSVDAVDTNSIVYKNGEPLSVQYSPGNPRYMIAKDSAHSHMWKNALLETFFALLALVVLGLVALLLRMQDDPDDESQNAPALK